MCEPKAEFRAAVMLRGYCASYRVSQSLELSEHLSLMVHVSLRLAIYHITTLIPCPRARSALDDVISTLQNDLYIAPSPLESCMCCIIELEPSWVGKMRKHPTILSLARKHRPSLCY